MIVNDEEPGACFSSLILMVFGLLQGQEFVIKDSILFSRVYRFSTKLDLDFGTSWGDVGWYGDPTKQFSNLKTHKRESASHF